MMISLFVAALSATSVQASGATPATPPARAPRERRICRSDERLGTILPRRVCRTASDWAAIDREQEKITNRDVAFMRDHRRTSMFDPGNPSQ